MTLPSEQSLEIEILRADLESTKAEWFKQQREGAEREQDYARKLAESQQNYQTLLDDALYMRGKLATTEQRLEKATQAYESLRIADQQTLTETLAAAIEQQQRADTCPPRLTLTATALADGGFSLNASCPKGWKVNISKAAIEKYNKSNHGYADAINLYSDATCVKDDEKASGE